MGTGLQRRKVQEKLAFRRRHCDADGTLACKFKMAFFTVKSYRPPLRIPQLTSQILREKCAGALHCGAMAPACGKTRSAYYTYQHIIEADSVRAALKKGLPMTSLVNDERSVAMPRERGRPKGRVSLVTANLMLVERGPQTPLDDEVRKQVVRLGWQRSKDK